MASIMKNIGEGFGRWYHKEFAQFLRYARGSTFEVAECVKDRCSAGLLDRERNVCSVEFM